ncbi:MAG: ABC transporter ATP-binding protein [Coriobacteriia bacterium]|nr:ABC transporter ATP-binding protein [Coriobacteriia bacterium]
MGADHVRSATAVSARGLTVTYAGRTVLDVDHIELAPSETYVLLGSSGAGKSTLLRVLGLLEEPTSGQVLYGGEQVARADLAARRRIAAVFQKPHLLRGTVGDNVAYGLKLRGVPRTERAERVAASLETVGLGGWEKRPALTLSGGEAQRVALARAIVLRPNLLLLDEPLSYLDPVLKRDLTDQFAAILSSEDVTALYVTHDQDEAAVVADRIGVMRDGRIVAEGAPDEVLALPCDDWVAAFVGTEPPVVGRVTTYANGVATLTCGSGEVFAVTDLLTDTEVVFGVRPEDVMLFEDGVEIPLSSARNQLACTVVRVIPQGAAVRVVLDAGCFRLASSISHGSAKALGVEPGARLTAVFKATAVRVATR